MRSTGAGDFRALWTLLAVALVVAGIGITGGFAPMDGSSDPSEEPPTTWTVDVSENGDARVTVTMRFRLVTENETRGFERLAAEFENGTADVLSRATFDRAAELAAGETNRSMRVEAVERSTAIENDTGRLRLSFTWTAFARASGDRLAVGDVFRSPSGTWLPRLTDRQEMVIDFPPRYAPESLNWPVRDGAVFVDGPVTFAPGEPSVTFEKIRPNVSVREVTLDRERAIVGEPVTVNATVENIGRAAGAATLELRIYDGTVETRRIQVDPESSRTVTFTRVFDSPAVVPVSVNDVGAGTLTIEEPPANLSIESATLDRDRIRPGEQATVRAIVANDGGENGSLPLVLSVNGSATEMERVTIEPGASRTVNLSRTFAERGTVRISVNGVEAGVLTVGEPTPTPPTRSTTVAPPTTTAPSMVTTPPPTSPAPPGENDVGPLMGILSMVVILGVLAYFVRQREDGIPGAVTGDGGDPGDESPGAGEAPGSADGPASEGAGGDVSNGAAAGGAAATAAAVGGDGEAGENGETDAPLLSDEEQVLVLLRKNDGRMKQAEIVDATDWSNAKVSQLLSRMAESGEILKLRIGRENLITLPEEAPEGAG
jgi:uncharacterized membrane protein